MENKIIYSILDEVLVESRIGPETGLIIEVHSVLGKLAGVYTKYKVLLIRGDKLIPYLCADVRIKCLVSSTPFYTIMDGNERIWIWRPEYISAPDREFKIPLP